MNNIFYLSAEYNISHNINQADQMLLEKEFLKIIPDFLNAPDLKYQLYETPIYNLSIIKEDSTLEIEYTTPYRAMVLKYKELNPYEFLQMVCDSGKVMSN